MNTALLIILLGVFGFFTSGGIYMGVLGALYKFRQLEHYNDAYKSEVAFYGVTSTLSFALALGTVVMLVANLLP